MALTQWQQDSARFGGGKDLVNRKRHLAQVKSALLKLCKEIGEDRDNHAGALTAKELGTLRDAAHLVARIEAGYAKDASQAQRIQADWQARHKLSMKVLQTLPHEAPEDVIALSHLAGELRPDGLLDACVRWGWQRQLCDIQHDALATLGHRCANQTTPPAQWCKALAEQIPAAKALHADLIAQVNALAVADQLQQAAA